MLGSLFDMDNRFWRSIGKIPDILVLSLMFYLCCIPVVTIIPASCALFDAVSRCVVMDQKGCYSRFLRSFVRELKRGIPLTLFWLLIGVISLLGNQILWQNAQGSDALQILTVIYRIFMLFAFAFLGWLIPLQSRYSYSFVQLHITAISFFFARLPGSIWMFIVTVAVVLVSFLHPTTFILLLVAPGLIAVIHSRTVEKAFRIAFPNDYVDGKLVTTPEEREAALRILEDKQKGL